jgi:hypothetical protein
LVWSVLARDCSWPTGRARALAVDAGLIRVAADAVAANRVHKSAHDVAARLPNDALSVMTGGRRSAALVTAEGLTAAELLAGSRCPAVTRRTTHHGVARVGVAADYVRVGTTFRELGARPDVVCDALSVATEPITVRLPVLAADPIQFVRAVLSGVTRREVVYAATGLTWQAAGDGFEFLAAPVRYALATGGIGARRTTVRIQKNVLLAADANVTIIAARRLLYGATILSRPAAIGPVAAIGADAARTV